MDYIDFQVRRIADELETAGIPIPGQHPTTATDDPPINPVTNIAKGYKSRRHLPRWMWEHRNDPALMVTTLLISLRTED